MPLFWKHTTSDQPAGKEETVQGSVRKLDTVARMMGLPKDVEAKLDEAARKAKESLVYDNMRQLHRAVVKYSVYHHGNYPVVIDNSMNTYLLNMNTPGLDDQYIPGKGIVNPYTGKPEWPTVGNVMDVSVAQNSDPPAMHPGQIQYNAINGTSSAILGGGIDGKALPEQYGRFKTEVLSDPPVMEYSPNSTDTKSSQ